MQKKYILRALCLALCAVLLFSFAGCSKDDESKEKHTVKAKNEDAVAKVDNSMKEYESSVYSIDLTGEVDTVIVYHKDDVIYGIDQHSIGEAGDRSKTDIDFILEKVEEKYAEISKKDFVKFKVYYSEDQKSLIMTFKARNLDNKENLQAVANLGIFGALSGDSTFKEFEDTLLKMKFVKK